jgi:hypothetical protein
MSPGYHATGFARRPKRWAEMPQCLEIRAFRLVARGLDL